MVAGPGAAARAQQPLKVVIELRCLQQGSPLQAFGHQIRTGSAQRTALHPATHRRQAITRSVECHHNTHGIAAVGIQGTAGAVDVAEPALKEGNAGTLRD
jgi:hypothetical protein